MEKDQIDRFRARGTRVGVYAKDAEKPVGARLTTETEAIDSMSFNLGIVLGVYLLSFLFLKGVTFLLSLAGSAGNDLAVNLWGISFVFAAGIAMLVKKVMSLLKLDHVTDNGSLTRICGTSVDIMVAASIGAISLIVVSKYWLPILSMGTLGGLAVIFGVLAISSRLFTDHQFYRAIMIYGACTGTLTTGLALLRVLDPDFETPVAEDYVYATGIVFLLAIPLILMINLPAYGHSTGNPIYYWITVGILGGYLIFTAVSYILLARKRAFKNSSLFLKPETSED